MDISRIDSAYKCNEDYKMIIEFKPKLVAYLLVGFSIFFLYCSTAYAEKRMKKTLNASLTKDIVTFELSLSDIDETSKFAYPAITNEIYNNYQKMGLNSSFQPSNKPMKGIKVADFANIVPRNFDKKNTFFEFAAKFNDKLQQVIAYFNFSSKNAETKENSNEKKQKRKVNFVIKSIN